MRRLVVIFIILILLPLVYYAIHRIRVYMAHKRGIKKPVELFGYHNLLYFMSVLFVFVLFYIFISAITLQPSSGEDYKPAHIKEGRFIKGKGY